MIMLLALAASVALESKSPDKASFFFRCKLADHVDATVHELDLTYFEPAPEWAMGFNYRDPDGILPQRMRPMVASGWPTALMVKFEEPSSSRPIATLAFRPLKSEPGRAAVEINWNTDRGELPSSYAGECSFTEGSAAERQYQELLNQ
jgi:hypothetical protein